LQPGLQFLAARWRLASLVGNELHAVLIFFAVARAARIGLSIRTPIMPLCDLSGTPRQQSKFGATVICDCASRAAIVSAFSSKGCPLRIISAQSVPAAGLEVSEGCSTTSTQ